MTSRRPLRLLSFILLMLSLAACAPALAVSLPLKLASSTENGVSVDIFLERDPTGGFILAAAFTPEAGFHLYSMDLPREGVNGQGRPTLLELTPGTRLQAAGELSESVAAEQATGPEGLRIYPDGPVTLRLAVVLPVESGWFDDRVSVSYMACSGNRCKAPVIAKLIPVRLPRMKEIKP